MARDTPLVDLLKCCAIPSNFAGNWFLGCTVEGNTLYVTSREQGERLARLFGEKLRASRPHLTMRVLVAAPVTPKPVKAQPPSYLNAAGRKAWQAEQLRLSETDEKA